MALSSLPENRRSASPKDVVTEADLVNELDSMALSSSPGAVGEKLESPSAHSSVSAPSVEKTDADDGLSQPRKSPLDPRSSEFKPGEALGSETETPADVGKPALDIQQTSDDPHAPAQVPAGQATAARPSLHSSRTPSISTATTDITPPISRHSLSPFTPSSGQVWATGAGSPGSFYTPLSSQFTEGDVFSTSSSKRVVASFPTQLASQNGLPPPNDIGRFLMVSNVPVAVDGEHIKQMIKNLAPFKAIVVKFLKTKGWFIVTFYDSRDAATVFDKLSTSSVRFTPHTSPVNLTVEPVSPDVVRQITGDSEEFDEVWKTSESLLSVKIVSDTRLGAEKIEDLMSRFGDVKSFYQVPGRGEAFLVDYYDTRIAAEVANLLNNHPCERGVLSVRFASEDPFQSEPLRDSRFQSAPGLYQPSSASYSSPAVSYTLGSAAYNPVNLVANVTSQPLHESYQDRNHQLNSQSHSAPWHAETSAQRRPVCGRDGVSWSTAGQAPEWSQAAAAPGNYQYQANHAVQPDLSGINNCANDPETLQAILNNMNATARARLAFSPPAAPIPWGEQRQAIPPENRVYPERLLTGKDNRTTVMVKDVPNKLSRQQLVNILREVVPDEFDFVYLRFDFNNHCNVGYAFVNFTSVRALYTFHQAKVGKRWNMFSSEKVLQISYANIQGKAALVNKFRNSQVMDVTEEWRPQIFYSSGAHRGEPEPFPEPDHPSSRHQRSTAARFAFLTGGAPYDGGDKHHPGPGSAYSRGGGV